MAKPLLAVATAGAIAALAAAGCGSDDNRAKTGDGGVDDLFGGGPKGPCTGLQCQVAQCAAGQTTSITGTVYAPNGTLPLYNVVVYVPNKPLDPIPEGASCDRCGNVSGDPVTTTLTDTRGRFTLKGVPAGDNIPLVIQVGKWRRELTMPKVASCADNEITDKNVTRLPRNKSEGHIPKIAVTTGRCDHLACLLPKLGLDASEYTASDGDGRLHVYRGAGHKGEKDANEVPAPAPAGSKDATDLWNSVDTLKQYDMTVLSCECGEHNENKSDAAKNALYEYSKIGGRVFSSHFHYTWFQNSPNGDVKSVAEWHGSEDNSSNDVPPFLVDTSFPKGQALADWLVNVSATTTKGQIPINQPRDDVWNVTKGKATRWVYNKAPFGFGPETSKYISFNAPVGQPVDKQCGKVVFGDMHITGTADMTTLPDDGFPNTCPKDLTPEEKALIFLFFDLSSCVQKDEDAPTAPAPK